MRHVFLRFNYAVEIGARLAYLGHYKATNDPKVLEIANEELEHRNTVERILASYGRKPFFLFNWFFLVVGTTIRHLCVISPKFMLNFVARQMELFANISYDYLAQVYPEHQKTFSDMADAEARHEDYFT